MRTKSLLFKSLNWPYHCMSRSAEEGEDREVSRRHVDGSFTSDVNKVLDSMAAKEYLLWVMTQKASGASKRQDGDSEEPNDDDQWGNSIPLPWTNETTPFLCPEPMRWLHFIVKWNDSIPLSNEMNPFDCPGLSSTVHRKKSQKLKAIGYCLACCDFDTRLKMLCIVYSALCDTKHVMYSSILLRGTK